MRTVALRVVALALLLLLVIAGVLSIRTLGRLPDAVVHLVADEGDRFRLAPVGRRLGVSVEEDPAAWADAVVTALAAGPTPAEAARGLSSAVPAGSRARGARLEASGGRVLLVVDLNAAAESGGGSASIRSRAFQLRYALTQPAAVDGVELWVEGVPARSFSSEGLLLDGPWWRAEAPERPAW